jgi:hypothetical protein
MKLCIYSSLVASSAKMEKRAGMVCLQAVQISQEAPHMYVMATVLSNVREIKRDLLLCI